MNADTGSAREYFFRLDQRLQAKEGVVGKIILIKSIAKSAEKHLKKSDLSFRRYKQALKSQDDVSIAYEKNILLALMYEIIDTSYIVLNLLNFDELDLDSSNDGLGLAGGSSVDVAQVLSNLDAQCVRVLRLETDLDIRIDFSHAVDERKGVTYTRHPHWKNFVAGDDDASFFSYFFRGQTFIKERMNQIPKFWVEQNFRQYLRRHSYHALLDMVARLEMYNFAQQEATLKDGQKASNMP
ncbi:hypothetical protein OAO01_00330 [Oligoflexia bacterium]|nr:hypothetical protein [Oligoflexia bacterium]